MDPDQTPHDVASDLGLHCLPMTLYGFLDKNGLKYLEYHNRLFVTLINILLIKDWHLGDPR